jgi:hypothetical protein
MGGDDACREGPVPRSPHRDSRGEQAQAEAAAERPARLSTTVDPLLCRDGVAARARINTRLAGLVVRAWQDGRRHQEGQVPAIS